jgi:hypothetical protein
MKKLWLDDVRQPPNNSWYWAKTVAQAIKYARANKINYMSLDHDLGAIIPENWTPDQAAWIVGDSRDGSGMDFVNWMVEHNVWPSAPPEIHSWNSTAAKRMCATIDDRGPYDEPARYKPFQLKDS